MLVYNFGAGGRCPTPKWAPRTFDTTDVFQS